MKPTTNSFKNSAGSSFNSGEVIQGIVNTWGTNDIVSQINGPVSAEAIADNSGKILRYRYFATIFSTIQDRKPLVAADQAGTAIDAASIIAEEITVDLDDERSTKPEYIDSWDEKKLEDRVNLRATKNGQWPILSAAERAERYFEAARKAAKAAEAAALNDGVTRVVDTTGAGLTDIDFVKLLQKGGDQLVAQKNSRRKGTPRAFLAYVLTPSDLTRVANTQAFTGSNVAGAALADGAVGKLNGIMVYENIFSNISFVMIRGAVVVPIANPEIVTYPAKSNAMKIAFEYALPKAGSEGILYADGIVAFGAPAVINA